MHEDTIASDEPFGQVAIELEIEGISVAYAPKLLAACKRALGPEMKHGVSFLAEHVAIDVGHTAFNCRLMGELCTARPLSASDSSKSARAHSTSTFASSASA